jgi:hypothetical protein
MVCGVSVTDVRQFCETKKKVMLWIKSEGMAELRIHPRRALGFPEIVSGMFGSGSVCPKSSCI